MTTLVALLVSILLVSHIGLPHCANTRAEAAATPSTAADRPADPLIHVSDLDSATLPARHGHGPAVLLALAVTPDPAGAAASPPGIGADPPAGIGSARPVRSILQVYRCCDAPGAPHPRCRALPRVRSSTRGSEVGVPPCNP